LKTEKKLAIYEVDLGLNHVIRKNLDTVPATAHKLIPIPGTLG
jgi:splicing factor 3B subunit 3